MYWYHFLIRVKDAVVWSEGEEGNAAAAPAAAAALLPPPPPQHPPAPTGWQAQWPLTPQPTPCGGGTSLLARSGAQPGPQLAPQPGPQLAGSSSDSPAQLWQAQHQMQAQMHAQQMQMQAMQVQMQELQQQVQLEQVLGKATKQAIKAQAKAIAQTTAIIDAWVARRDDVS